MKNNPTLIVLFGMIVAVPRLWAQASTTLGENSRVDGADSLIELSPFVVNSSKDTGYQAASTLAGSRLNTPLKDLGASISVYTKDFLEDIGATNANELLIYATGMEAAGSGGNFSGATNDINAAQVVGDTVRSNPQSGSRTRGLSAPNFTRGFFNSVIPTDSYNIQNITVNRGPNAILFGVGSPAGVVEATLLRPNLNRDSNKISIRYGNNDSVRNAVDFNRVLVGRKLGLRIAALDDNEKFNQRPAYEETKRIYGALAFEPYRSTALRLNFESGNTRANRPITVLPFNSISSAWEAGGRPGFDWTYYDDPVRNPNAAAQIVGTPLEGILLGRNQLFDQVTAVYSNSSGLTPDFAFRSQTNTTTGNAANAVKAQLYHPLANRDLANDSIRFLSTTNIFELPASYWVGANVLPGQQPNFAPAGIKMQGFTDFSAFDFKNRMIDESSLQTSSFHACNVSFEQRALDDHVGIELAYDAQRVDRRSRNAAFSTNNASHIRVDTNVVLPNGQPNPNYGRPYANVYGQAAWRNDFSDREAKRATAFFKYDFNEGNSPWASLLGRHTLTGLYEENTTKTISYQHRLAADGLAARDISSDINAFARRPAVVVYMGPSIIGNNNPLRLEPISVPFIEAGPLPVSVSQFVRAANATDPGAFVDTSATLLEINNGGNANRDVIKSQAFLMQSYWLKEHLITLVGWRRDEDRLYRQSIGYVANPANTNDPGKVHYGFNDVSYAGVPVRADGETMTYSGVLRWPNRLARLPLGAEVSIFYNQSSNFTPSGGRVDAFGDPLASPKGRTQEFGFNVSSLNNRFSMRVNWFETKVLGQTSTPPVYNTVFNNAILQRADVWGVEENANPHLAAQSKADIELLFSPLPENFRDLYGYKIIGSSPNLAAAGRITLAGSGDTTDFTAKGMEYEFVLNPTRNWRIMANVAKQETVQSNSLPFLKKVIAMMTPVWNQLRDRPYTNYPLGWQPGDSLVDVYKFGEWLDANVFVPFATALATEGSVSAEQRKWRANFVTNYKFSRGSFMGDALNGISIGAAVRWQDKLAIGYPTTRNLDSSVTLDLQNPYYAPAETNIDAWIGYENKIMRGRVNWTVQLNVRNLFGQNDPIAIGIQPWGEISTVRLAPERRWYLTNTFSF